MTTNTPAKTHHRSTSIAPKATQADPEVKLEIIGYTQMKDPAQGLLRPGAKQVTVYNISIEASVLNKVISRPWSHFVELYDKLTAVSKLGNEKPLVIQNLTTIAAKLTLNPKKKREERKKQGEIWLKTLWAERRLRYFVCQFLEVDFEVLCPSSAMLAEKDHDSFRKQQAMLIAKEESYGNDKSASKKAIDSKKNFMEKSSNEFLYCLIDLGMTKSFTLPKGTVTKGPPQPQKPVRSASSEG